LISVLNPETSNKEEKDNSSDNNKQVNTNNTSNRKFIYYIIGLILILAIPIIWWLGQDALKPNKETTVKKANEQSITENVNQSKFIPNDIKIGIEQIKKYYKSFESENKITSTIQSFYNPILMDYHGRKYVTSLEAKNRDLEDFTTNSIKSYKISVDDKSITYDEFEYYYLIKTNLDYLIKKNDGQAFSQKFAINIALTKDQYKILAISKTLDPSKIDDLISEEVEVNIDDRLYYEKGIKDPNIIAIRG